MIKSGEAFKVPATPKPGDFPLGSIESRAAARALGACRTETEVFRVRIVHIGHNGKDPLPLPQFIKWDGGATEIIHVAGERP